MTSVLFTRMLKPLRHHFNLFLTNILRDLLGNHLHLLLLPLQHLGTFHYPETVIMSIMSTTALTRYGNMSRPDDLKAFAHRLQVLPSSLLLNCLLLSSRFILCHLNFRSGLLMTQKGKGFIRLIPKIGEGLRLGYPILQNQCLSMNSAQLSRPV